MSQQETYREWPIGYPVQIGASKIDQERVQGPPSRMLPTLRDLATGEIRVNTRAFTSERIAPRVTIEVDLPAGWGRKEGVITGMSHRVGQESLVLNRRDTIKLGDILAFRVISVEIPESSMRSDDVAA